MRRQSTFILLRFIFTQTVGIGVSTSIYFRDIGAMSPNIEAIRQKPRIVRLQPLVSTTIKVPAFADFNAFSMADVVVAP